MRSVCGVARMTRKASLRVTRAGCWLSPCSPSAGGTLALGQFSSRFNVNFKLAVKFKSSKVNSINWHKVRSIVWNIDSRNRVPSNAMGYATPSVLLEFSHAK